jgi:hypothetical protein
MRLHHDDAYQLAREEEVISDYEARQEAIRMVAPELVCHLCGKKSTNPNDLCYPRGKK